MFFPGDSRFLRSLELSHEYSPIATASFTRVSKSTFTNTPLFDYITNTQMPLHSSHRYYEIHSYIRAENPENPEEEDSKISLP
ncbi:hypothetical protein TWF569_000783 [Orbilia oligospora]|nr:hypothetical protein TWF569_000783 [Orbilia oligospora]